MGRKNQGNKVALVDLRPCFLLRDLSVSSVVNQENKKVVSHVSALVSVCGRHFSNRTRGHFEVCTKPTNVEVPRWISSAVCDSVHRIGMHLSVCQSVWQRVLARRTPSPTRPPSALHATRGSRQVFRLKPIRKSSHTTSSLPTWKTNLYSNERE